jgi:hypothetical protein
MDSGEVERAFRDWTVENMTDEQLIEILRHLTTQAIPNPDIRHTQLLSGAAVNHIQMARVIADLKATIRKMNSDNARTQILVIILAVVAVIVGAIQAAAAVLSLCR